MPVTIAQTDDINACLRLRRIVFIEEQNVPEHEELDGLDATALHVLAADEEPVGCARILLKSNVAKIGRVCVLPSHRGTGLGADIIRHCIEVAKAYGASRAVLGAQTHALGFYEKLGFTAFGAVYDDAGIPHQDMERPL
ncbi:MAG: GNAT family N-acetyltransferase [Pseudomonadota bacterium]